MCIRDMFIGIVLILLGNPLVNQIGVPLDQIMIWISVVLAVWSCTDYIVTVSYTHLTADETMNAMRDGMFALIRPVIISVDGRCVATIR